MKLIKRKERGQAFSTFQLLIAAVVALALLGVLMPIIGGINPGTDRLVDALEERINTQQNQYGTVSLTDDIKISGRSDPYISTETITNGTGMDHKQVLFMLNDYENDFSTTDGSVLEIINTSRITYQFGVLCSGNKTNLDTSLASYTSIIKDNTLLGSFDDEEIRVCVVFPVKR
jgi:hypothetical protein